MEPNLFFFWDNPIRWTHFLGHPDLVGPIWASLIKLTWFLDLIDCQRSYQDLVAVDAKLSASEGLLLLLPLPKLSNHGFPKNTFVCQPIGICILCLATLFAIHYDLQIEVHPNKRWFYFYLFFHEQLLTQEKSSVKDKNKYF